MRLDIDRTLAFDRFRYIHKTLGSSHLSRSAANIAKHGYDPAEFEVAFSFDRYLSRRAKPSLTGRERLLLVGTWFGETVVTVIISPLGTEACDVVSVRDASDKERAAYDEI